VLFFGYGSSGLGEPDPRERFNFQPIRRTADYFFVKFSYLMRL
jgi:hypothetical protein